MTPALWINEENRIGRGYYAPARNNYVISALKRKWIGRILIIVAVPLAVIAVFALGEVIGK
jgi:hypothetical protein